MLKLINAPTGATITAIAYNTATNAQVSTSKTLSEIRPGTYQYNPALEFADGAYDFRLFDGATVLGEVPYTLQGGVEATIATRSRHSAAEVTTPILTAGADWTTADLTPLSNAIALIPTTPLLAESYTAPDNTTIAAIAANAFDPSSDLVNVGQVAGFAVSGLGDFKADLSATNDAIALIPTDNDLSSIDVIVQREAANVIAEGSSNWTAADLTATNAAIALIPTNPLLADAYTAPNNTGIGELTALLTPDNLSFTGKALENAPTGGTGGGSGLSAEQATQISTLYGLVHEDGDRFSGLALSEIPQPDLSAIPTTNTLDNITAAIESAKTDVLTAGAGWETVDLSATDAAIAAIAGIATEERLSQLEGLDAIEIASQVRTVLTTQLDSIQDAATLAAVPLIARTIDTDSNAVTTYRDDAGDIIYQAQTFGVDSQPNYEQVTRQERLSNVPV